ncbi:MAG: NADH-quinone oxidoreductase subunit NuoH [Planctomycetes bacterium]|nr:NADH-quinone oxidoreductase subunit NuoH [Planctomycetota bacterium]
MEYLINFFKGSAETPGFFSYLGAYIVCMGVAMGIYGVYAMFAIWMERKVSGHMQSRVGPMRTGAWHGWAQSIADAIKLFVKEDIRPKAAETFWWILAPALVFTAAIAGFVALPISAGWIINDLNLGLFFIISIASIEVIGVIMAGWSSNNKWSLFGAIREAAQVVSYEIPAALALMVVILCAGSFSLVDIVDQQQGNWFIWQSPWLALSAFLYFLASLAGCKRAPFDIPEAESELVAGFHTEYSGLRFAFFFMEEYASMLIVAAIFSASFLGGWNLPGIDLPFADGFIWVFLGALIFFAKVMFIIFVQMWLRWTLPRLRVDQVMTIAYKYLIPFAFLAVVGAAIFEYYDWKWIPGVF